ncbi:hypothetical protein C8F04DRAFT_1123652 [Mycena alexandri]|uniref:PHD-type domain-containing protein n=1 Tax=Mycena alexandri TaxID=1745969 RepID=A0AAD6SHR2_9AGAR|nr:hypothetical protein C8F04DRAFT_1123652 [Mycena alexandri]
MSDNLERIDFEINYEALFQQVRNLVHNTCAECRSIGYYGEMVRCAQPGCHLNVHLSCVGLSAAPENGSWFCDKCQGCL